MRHYPKFHTLNFILIFSVLFSLSGATAAQAQQSYMVKPMYAFPPVAVADDYDAIADEQLLVDAAHGVLANDTDADGDELTAQLVGQGTAHGTLSLKANGSFTYTPDPGYVGSDVFVYKASDGVFTSSPVNVTIDVAAGDNTPPVANSDNYDVASGTILTTTLATGVLANDTDAEGNPLTAALVGQGTVHGALEFDSDGTFEYTPDVGYVGSDVFVYEASDGVFTSNPVNVTINVTSGDETPPIANPDTYEVTSGIVLTTTAATGVLANDTDAELDILSAALVSEGTVHGTLDLETDGSFTYTPELGYIGSDTFVYEASDGLFTSDPVKVTINVVSGDQTPPVANADSYEVATGTVLTTTALTGVLANDTDAELDILTAALVGAGTAHGTLTINSDGSFMYVPEGGYIGSDTFTYEASDGLFVSNPVKATINVTSGDQTPPVANSDNYEIESGLTLTVDAASGVLANDTDAELDVLSATVVGMGTAHGTLIFNTDGSFSYTPDHDYIGTDVFVYEASDGLFISEPVNVTINVIAGAETPPVANSDTYEATTGEILIVDAENGVLANDTDAEGDTLTAVIIGEGTVHGILSFNRDGSFSYTPDQGYLGSDIFVYEASDGLFDSNPVNVTINVVPPVIIFHFIPIIQK